MIGNLYGSTSPFGSAYAPFASSSHRTIPCLEDTVIDPSTPTVALDCAYRGNGTVTSIEQGNCRTDGEYFFKVTSSDVGTFNTHVNLVAGGKAHNSPQLVRVKAGTISAAHTRVEAPPCGSNCTAAGGDKHAPGFSPTMLLPSLAVPAGGWKTQGKFTVDDPVELFAIAFDANGRAIHEGGEAAAFSGSKLTLKTADTGTADMSLPSSMVVPFQAQFIVDEFTGRYRLRTAPPPEPGFFDPTAGNSLSPDYVRTPGIYTIEVQVGGSALTQTNVLGEVAIGVGKIGHRSQLLTPPGKANATYIESKAATPTSVRVQARDQFGNLHITGGAAPDTFRVAYRFTPDASGSPPGAPATGNATANVTAAASVAQSIEIGPDGMVLNAFLYHNDFGNGTYEVFFMAPPSPGTADVVVMVGNATIGLVDLAVTEGFSDAQYSFTGFAISPAEVPDVVSTKVAYPPPEDFAWKFQPGNARVYIYARDKENSTALVGQFRCAYNALSFNPLNGAVGGPQDPTKQSLHSGAYIPVAETYPATATDAAGVFVTTFPAATRWGYYEYACGLVDTNGNVKVLEGGAVNGLAGGKGFFHVTYGPLGAATDLVLPTEITRGEKATLSIFAKDDFGNSRVDLAYQKGPDDISAFTVRLVKVYGFPDFREEVVPISFDTTGVSMAGVYRLSFVPDLFFTGSYRITLTVISPTFQTYTRSATFATIKKVAAADGWGTTYQPTYVAGGEQKVIVSNLVPLAQLPDPLARPNITLVGPIVTTAAAAPATALACNGDPLPFEVDPSGWDYSPGSSPVPKYTRPSSECTFDLGTVQAGVYSLLITLDNLPIGCAGDYGACGNPYSILIQPGEADPQFSGLLADKIESFQAGVDVALGLAIKDKYGNLASSSSVEVIFTKPQTPTVAGVISLNTLGTNYVISTNSGGVGKLTQKGTYTVIIGIDGVPFQEQEFEIVPGALDLAKTKLGGSALLEFWNADTPLELDVVLRDTYSNVIELDPSAASTLTVSLVLSGPKTGELKYTLKYVGGVFTVKYDLIKVDKVTQTLDVNGVAFALPDVEITAGAVDPAKTLVQGQTPTLATVGDKSVLHLTLRDKNSNQVKVKDAANVAAAWTGSRFQSSEKGIKEKDVYPIPVSGVAVLPTGVVEMSFEFFEVSQYELLVFYNQAPVPTGEFKITTRAGPLDASKSSVVGTGLLSGTSGEPSTFSVRLNDQFGQPRVGQDALKVSITERGGAKLQYTIDASSSLSAAKGEYTITYTPIKDGVNTIVVAVAAAGDIVGPPGTSIAAVGDVPLGTFSPTIAAGPISPANCEIFGPGATGALSGTESVFYIRAKDINGNVNEDGDAALLIDTGLEGLYTPDGQPPAGVLWAYTGLGIYTVTYRFYDNPSLFNAPVTVGVQLLQDTGDPIDLAGSPLALSIGTTSAAFSASLSTVELDGATVPAGESGYLHVFPKDIYSILMDGLPEGKFLTLAVGASPLAEYEVLNPGATESGIRVGFRLSDVGTATVSVYATDSFNSTAYSLVDLIGTVTVEVVTGPMSLAKSKFEASPGALALTVNETAGIEITPYDAFGNAIDFSKTPLLKDFQMVLKPQAELSGRPCTHFGECIDVPMDISFDADTNAYSASGTALRPGVYDVAVTLGSQTETLKAEFIYGQGPVSAETTTILGPGLYGSEAGTKKEVRVAPFDQFRNPMEPGGVLECSVTLEQFRNETGQEAFTPFPVYNNETSPDRLACSYDSSASSHPDDWYFQLEYTLTQAATYRLSVTLTEFGDGGTGASITVTPNPEMFHVEPGAPSAIQSEAPEMVGQQVLPAGVSTFFTVVSRDSYGNEFEEPGYEVVATISKKSEDGTAVAAVANPLEVRYVLYGRYEVHIGSDGFFKIKEPGDYQVDVNLGGQPIKGSPFIITATAPPTTALESYLTVDGIRTSSCDKVLKLGECPTVTEFVAGEEAVVSISANNQFGRAATGTDDTFVVVLDIVNDMVSVEEVERVMQGSTPPALTPMEGEDGKYKLASSFTVTEIMRLDGVYEPVRYSMEVSLVSSGSPKPQPLGNSPMVFSLISGPIYQPNTELVATQETFEMDGDQLKSFFKVVTKDEFGNPGSYNPDTPFFMEVSASGPAPAVADFKPIRDAEGFQTGSYLVGIASITSGDYVVTVTTTDIDLTTGANVDYTLERAVSLVPGDVVDFAIYAQDTVVGTDSAVEIRGMDRFGNFAPSANGLFDAISPFLDVPQGMEAPTVQSIHDYFDFTFELLEGTEDAFEVNAVPSTFMVEGATSIANGNPAMGVSVRKMGRLVVDVEVKNKTALGATIACDVVNCGLYIEPGYATVSAGDIALDQALISGPGVLGAVAGLETQFTVEFADVFGNPVAGQCDLLGVREISGTADVVELLVSTAADGSCGVEYSFSLAGAYELEVAYGDAILGVYTIDVVPEAGILDPSRSYIKPAAYVSKTVQAGSSVNFTLALVDENGLKIPESRRDIVSVEIEVLEDT